MADINATDASELAKAGLSSADIAGLTGASLQINPYMAGIAGLSTLPSFYQAYQQSQDIKQLKKRGITDITPEAFKQYQALVNQQAASAAVPGESIAKDEIAKQQAAAQANIERMAQTPSQALRASLGANQQAIQARNQITMAGAREQARRRALANEALMKRGMYQDQSRKEYAAALAALEAAKMQNINKGVQGGLSGLLNSFVVGGPKKSPTDTTGTETTTTPGSTGASNIFTTTETGAAVPGYNPNPYGFLGNTFGKKDVPYELPY